MIHQEILEELDKNIVSAWAVKACAKLKLKTAGPEQKKGFGLMKA